MLCSSLSAASSLELMHSELGFCLVQAFHFLDFVLFLACYRSNWKGACRVVHAHAEFLCLKMVPEGPLLLPAAVHIVGTYIVGTSGSHYSFKARHTQQVVCFVVCNLIEQDTFMQRDLWLPGSRAVHMSQASLRHPGPVPASSICLPSTHAES